MVTEPCAYALESDWNRIPAVLAEWMAKQLGGKGKVFVDRGLAGAPISAQLENGYATVLDEVSRTSRSIGNYNGEYALGPEQAGVASLLAANPRGRRHPDPGLRHRRHPGAEGRRPPDRAGHRASPTTSPASTCAQTEGAKCILGSNPAFLSSEAIKLAVDILERQAEARRPPHPGQRRLPAPPTPFEVGALSRRRSCRRSRSARTPSPISPPGLTLPITPDWVEITAEEAAGS